LSVVVVVAVIVVVVIVVVVVVDGQPKQREPPETHFPKSQTSTG